MAHAVSAIARYRPDVSRHNARVSVDAHKAQAPRAVAVYVLTVSDTRTADTDTSGRAVRELVEAAGHVVAGGRIVPDDPHTVTAVVRDAAADAAVQAVLITGGTGLTARDSTFEAVDGLFHKRLSGFGELFRMLSFQEIGAAAMLSRATAGTIGRTVVFVMPGSEHAVRLAMTRLVVPELSHIAQQLAR